MKRSALIAICLSFAWLLNACNSNPNRPHEANLIDDKVTSQRVQAALTRAGPQFKSIKVATTNGTVILTGSINSEANRSHAETVARRVHRVKDVQDDLQVKQ